MKPLDMKCLRRALEVTVMDRIRNMDKRELWNGNRSEPEYFKVAWANRENEGRMTTKIIQKFELNEARGRGRHKNR